MFAIDKRDLRYFFVLEIQLNNSTYNSISFQLQLSHTLTHTKPQAVAVVQLLEVISSQPITIRFL